MHEHDEVVLELDSAFGQVPKESCYNVNIYIYSQIHIYTYTYRIVTDCNIYYTGVIHKMTQLSRGSFFVRHYNEDQCTHFCQLSRSGFC